MRTLNIKIYSFFNRMIMFFNTFKKMYKHGGITFVNISYLNSEEILNGKNILITGGGSGIGLAIAKKCILSGANVIITGRNILKLENAIRELKTDKCHAVSWDISNVNIIKEKINECEGVFGSPIDVLVNNAGIAPSKFWGEVDEIEWDSIYSINLKGVFFLTQEIVKRWKLEEHKNYKKIINISSQGGFVGATYPYRMVKWDIRGFTEGLGKSLINNKIIVNGIAPGIVKTSMQSFSLEQKENLYTDQNPIKRICLPEEIAELASFLISDTSNFIIGQTIVCDGGYILK